MPQSRPRFDAGAADDLAKRGSQVAVDPAVRPLGPPAVLLGEDVDASLGRLLEGRFQVRAQQREQRDDAVRLAQVLRLGRRYVQPAALPVHVAPGEGKSLGGNAQAAEPGQGHQ
ncbi:hypothetical protein [Thermogutta sp.]|uniref:hypothetical protein n=1 Tax=Thermogutta sp. TaxID=1962930 RepID=UPI00322001F4